MCGRDSSGDGMAVTNEALLAIDAGCGCHLVVVVVHVSGGGVVIMAVMVAVNLPSCTTIYYCNDDHLMTTTNAVNITHSQYHYSATTFNTHTCGGVLVTTTITQLSHYYHIDINQILPQPWAPNAIIASAHNASNVSYSY